MQRMDPYLHIRLLEQERERTMARNALVRAARSAKYEESAETPGRRIGRRNPLLRLAAVASGIANLGSKALHTTRTSGL